MPKLVRTFKKSDRRPITPVATQELEKKPSTQRKAARQEFRHHQATSLKAGRKAVVAPSPTVQTPSSGDAWLWLAFLNEVNYVGDEVSMPDVRQRLRRYAPKVPDGQSATEASAARDSWDNCIAWVRIHLIRRGCLLAPSRGVVQLTAPGKRWLEANWRGPDRTYAKVKKPPVLAQDTQPAKAARVNPAPRMIGKEGRSTDEARLARRRIKSALAGKGRPRLDVVDQYLLGVVALELALPSDAASLLGAAIEMGLDDQFLGKALRLREMCLVQMGR